MLRPKDSEGTCIPSGVTTFLQTASRRSPSADYYGSSVTLGLSPRRPSRTLLELHVSMMEVFRSSRSESSLLPVLPSELH